jgi:hypothetical protein
MTRQQLPPQITKITVADRKTGKAVVRYQVTVDTGHNPQTGRRQQVRRRYTTEKQARDALAEIQNSAATGTFVSRSTLTIEQLCADYLASRRRLRASSLAKLEYDLAPLRERLGQVLVQRLAKTHIDAMVGDLIAGGSTTAKGRQRRPWSADSINKAIAATGQVLADAKAQGIVSRNVAELVSRVNKPHQPVDTYIYRSRGAKAAGIDHRQPPWACLGVSVVGPPAR